MVPLCQTLRAEKLEMQLVGIFSRWQPSNEILCFLCNCCMQTTRDRGVMMWAFHLRNDGSKVCVWASGRSFRAASVPAISFLTLVFSTVAERGRTLHHS